MLSQTVVKKGAEGTSWVGTKSLGPCASGGQLERAWARCTVHNAAKREEGHRLIGQREMVGKALLWRQHSVVACASLSKLLQHKHYVHTRLTSQDAFAICMARALLTYTISRSGLLRAALAQIRHAQRPLDCVGVPLQDIATHFR